MDIKKNRLAELRKQSGYSQKDFYKKILIEDFKYDITLRTLQNWESGKSQIKSDIVSRIAEFFNVSVPYLLNNSDEQNEITTDTTQRFILNSNTPNLTIVNNGRREFESLVGTDVKNKFEEEILNKFIDRSKFDNTISDPDKWQKKWLNEFYESFEKTTPPIRLILARYYAKDMEGTVYPMDKVILAKLFTNSMFGKVLDIRRADGTSVMSAYSATDGSIRFPSAGVYVVYFQIRDRENLTSVWKIPIAVDERRS